MMVTRHVSQEDYDLLQKAKEGKLKELTDEEIKAVYGEYFDVENFDWLHLQCIQAILKKAQEK